MFIAILLLLQTALNMTDPFAFFQPTVTVSAAQRDTLKSGNSITEMLPARGKEDAVFVAVPVTIDDSRLIAWERRIEALKKG